MNPGTGSVARESKSPGGVPGAGRLGLKLLFLSLSMLFAASIAGFLAVRARAPEWPPKGAPALPSGLWFSTLLIAASSASMQWGLVRIRRGQARALANALTLTFALGLAFLASQTANWISLAARESSAGASLYAFSFYLLTGLHAAHVVGGLVPLGIVTARARRGRYDAGSHSGVEYCTAYWHFLGAVWLVLFVILVLLG